MEKNINTDKEVTSISAEIGINKSKEQVWEVLKEIGAIQNFHPLIKKSATTTALKSGMGAKRSCELLPMGQMIEEVVAWNERKSFTMEVIGGSMLPPYVFMRGRIELFESDNQTIVNFTFSYKLKFGMLGKLMNILLIKPQFEKAPPKYVDGLKKYVEALSH